MPFRRVDEDLRGVQEIDCSALSVYTGMANDEIDLPIPNQRWREHKSWLIIHRMEAREIMTAYYGLAEHSLGMGI